MSDGSFKSLALSEVDKFLSEYPGVKTVNCMLVDMLGLIRGKQIGVNKLKNLTKASVALPKTILLQNSMGENFEIPAVSSMDPDYFAHGISGTLKPALWTSSSFMEGGQSIKKSATPNKGEKLFMKDMEHAHVFLNLIDNRGHPFPFNGRDLLRKIVELIRKDFGYKVALAIELEFYLFAQRSPGYAHPIFKRVAREETHIADFEMMEPVNHLYHYPYFSKANSECYGIDNLNSIAPFTEKLVDCLAAQGIETDGLSSEYGRGQFEVNLKYVNDPVLACDQSILLKYTLKTLAKQFGLNATFMAVPDINSPNGMHINVSLQEDGKNIFFNDSKNLKGRRKKSIDYISEEMMYCVGGLQATAHDAMLIFAPNFNSYKRYYTQGYSPGNVNSWGINNRTVSLRVPHFNSKDPDFRKAMRLEHRLAGADSNPYLATAAVLVGLYLGLKKKINPTRIVKQSTYRVALWENEIPSMVSSLQYWKKKQNVFRRFFGTEFCDTFYTHRITEWNYFLRSLSQLDFDWYAHY